MHRCEDTQGIGVMSLQAREQRTLLARHQKLEEAKKGSPLQFSEESGPVNSLIWDF